MELVPLTLSFFDNRTKKRTDHNVQVEPVVAQYIEDLRRQYNEAMNDCDSLEASLNESELLLDAFRNVN